MIFADKLIQLRKKCGWSQEELAEQMNVTRQSVSKWEGAQSMPDLEKMIFLSELFGVSLDYLLKEDVEEAEAPIPTDNEVSQRRVSIEEANEFLSLKAATSNKIAVATLLCILSPICLFVLGALSESDKYGISENAAVGIGLIVLIALVAAAVPIFIFCGSKTDRFSYLENENIQTEYGVTEMVKERQKKYKATYTRNNAIGACLCILSIIPVFGGIIISDDNDLILTIMLSATLLIAGIGVVFFIRCGVIWASFQKLLQEGGYSKWRKENRPATAAVCVSYWLIATAIYLVYSFATNNWEYSWIIWAVAGVVYPAVLAVLRVFIKKK